MKTIVGFLLGLIVLGFILVSVPVNSHCITSGLNDTMAAGSYFFTILEGQPVTITAGHVVMGKNHMIAFPLVIERNSKCYNVELLKYDRDFNYAILSRPIEFINDNEYVVSKQITSVGSKIVVVSNIYDLGKRDFYNYGHIVSEAFTIKGMWNSVIGLDVGIGPGASGGPVIIEGTNEVVGILVGKLIDRDLSFMVPIGAVRLEE